MNGIGLLTAMGLFCILFCCIWISLKTASLFGKVNSFLIPACVAMLCVIGMMDFLFSNGQPNTDLSIPLSSSEEHKYWFILLPYEALGMTILTGLLILALLKLYRLKSSGLNRQQKETYDNKIKKQKLKAMESCKNKMFKKDRNIPKSFFKETKNG